VSRALETLTLRRWRAISTCGEGYSLLGIGPHLGSQVLHYWKDPVGDEWEHYCDGDVSMPVSPLDTMC